MLCCQWNPKPKRLRKFFTTLDLICCLVVSDDASIREVCVGDIHRSGIAMACGWLLPSIPSGRIGWEWRSTCHRHVLEWAPGFKPCGLWVGSLAIWDTGPAQDDLVLPGLSHYPNGLPEGRKVGLVHPVVVSCQFGGTRTLRLCPSWRLQPDAAMDPDYEHIAGGAPPSH